jgi:hypothetical protein
LASWLWISFVKTQCLQRRVFIADGFVRRGECRTHAQGAAAATLLAISIVRSSRFPGVAVTQRYKVELSSRLEDL